MNSQLVDANGLKNQIANIVEKALPDVELGLMNKIAQENKSQKTMIVNLEETLREERELSNTRFNRGEQLEEELNEYKRRESTLKQSEYDVGSRESIVANRELELDHDKAIADLKIQQGQGMAAHTLHMFNIVFRPASTREKVISSIPLVTGTFQSQYDNDSGTTKYTKSDEEVVEHTKTVTTEKTEE